MGQGLPGSGKPKGMGLHAQLLSRALAAKASPAVPRGFPQVPCCVGAPKGPQKAPPKEKERKGKKERKGRKRTREPEFVFYITIITMRKQEKAIEQS